MFISFEGPEGSGKSTNAAWLADWLAGRGERVVRTREPGGTAVGERVRALLLADAPAASARAALLLFEAARAELVETVIRPALSGGAVVICDRFTDSTLAYQGFGEGLPLHEVRVANALATGGLVPDLTILLDLDPAIGLDRRARGADWNSMDARALSFHQRVRAGFRALAEQEPARWLVLDADQPLPVLHSAIAARLGDEPLAQQARGVQPSSGEEVRP